ncbi:hypothetical protein L596_015327 [Steinernema carpocapsae]|uniref:Uncharacterized protein n=1 Tax=Steinernema carpocapsae TaxID=34508 RepID=A0A4U5NFN2_STECR|nr:hypothetical protein L596_015327 [Steinernema carpocapsae]
MQTSSSFASSVSDEKPDSNTRRRSHCGRSLVLDVPSCGRLLFFLLFAPLHLCVTNKPLVHSTGLHSAWPFRSSN